MKRYREDLFSIWAGDKGKASVPRSVFLESVLQKYCQQAREKLDWFKSAVKGIEQQDDEVFDQLYRGAHRLCGLATVLNLPKLQHLFLLLETACDFARDIESFDHHSLDYVTALISDTSIKVVAELGNGKNLNLDITDVIGECETYLDDALKQHFATLESISTSAEAAKETCDDGAPLEEHEKIDALETDSISTTLSAKDDEPVEEINDEPEQLNVPPQKSGLVGDFCEESNEHLGLIGQQLVALEDTQEPLAVVNELFRSVHTIKAGARLLNIKKLEILTHELETLLHEVRKGQKPVTEGLVDVLLDGRKCMEKMVAEVASNDLLRTEIAPLMQALRAVSAGKEPVAIEKPSGTEKTSEPSTAESGAPTKAQVAQTKTQKSTTETIRVPTDKLDDVLNTASEIFVSRIRLQNDVSLLGRALEQLKRTMHKYDQFGPEALGEKLSEASRRFASDVQGTLRKQLPEFFIERLDRIVKQVKAELTESLAGSGITSAEELAIHIMAVEEIRNGVQKNVEDLEQLSSRLQTGAMSFRMVPISSLFGRFPAEVRDMARQVGKKVHLEVEENDTELDKVLINHLSHPLVHLIRNSVDHGIESPEERREKGKPEAGLIELKAAYRGSQAVIEIVDDGRGIDKEKILKKAIERELVTEQAANNLSEQEILEFIFEPGFSTVAQVSQLSGRGVGMDVVKTAIGHVQGTVTLRNNPGGGTTVSLKLPLTLAVVHILLLEENFQQFAFPILQVEEVVTVNRSELRSLGGNMMYNYRGQTLSLTTLSKILGFPTASFIQEELPLVILTEGKKRIGIVADKVLGMQVVLIKNLGKLVKTSPFVMGCTILSDSRLVLILNPWEMVNFVSEGSGFLLDENRSELHQQRERHKILIVDDSQIQRKNLNTILAQSGYSTELALNGFEALKFVRKQQFSAICVDVVMPLMDGFEFTERLRSIPGNEDLPVIFVTGRRTESEQERAKLLGAFDYFVKPVDRDALVRSLDRGCAGSHETIATAPRSEDSI